MNLVKEKEREVAELSKSRNELISRQLRENEVIEKLKKEMKDAADRRDQGAHEKLFKKLSDKTYETDALRADISKVEAALIEGRDVLGVLKEEQEARFQAFREKKEKERIEALEKSLSEEEEIIFSDILLICRRLGDLALKGSRPTGTGSTTISGRLASFFHDLPYRFKDKFLKSGYSPAPQMWPGLISFFPIIAGGDFVTVLKNSILEREGEFKKEFFDSEENL